MKFTIENINQNNIEIILVKDFCFEGYYPLLETKNWEKISSFNNK